MGQFGEELRRAREDRGISVEFVCSVTKVSARHIQALEEERFDELPGGVFRKGIVRGYLSAVGLEERPWMERFASLLREQGPADPAADDWSQFAENVSRGRAATRSGTGLRWLGVLLMVLMLLLCGWLAWRYVLEPRLAASMALHAGLTPPVFAPRPQRR